MTHRLACLALASLIFLAPRPAAAAPVTQTFDTVDTVELKLSGYYTFIVSGILVGQTTTSTLTFQVSNSSIWEQCQRFAVIAMDKPGKYRFAVVGDLNSNNIYFVNSCKLILRAP